jgi:hypothetical protein
MRSDLPPPPPGWKAGPRTSSQVDRVVWHRVKPAQRKREMTIMKRLLNYLELRLYKKGPLLPVSKEELLS